MAQPKLRPLAAKGDCQQHVCYDEIYMNKMVGKQQGQPLPCPIQPLPTITAALLIYG